ncbi:VCBS repeat-containing protein [bacterium]|nr:VCBS repeat-containing protein [bacterium]
MTQRLVGTVLLFGALSAWAGEVEFERLSFAGEAEYGVFTEDLDGDGARDLIALGRGRVSVYRRRPAALPQYPDVPEMISTGSAAYFADVADVLPAKGKELLILTPQGVACFAHEGGEYAKRPTMLLECETLLTTRPLRGAVGRAALRFTTSVLPWNFAFDADGDGLDDLLVPHGTGTDVYLQKKERGTFAKPITLPLFPMVSHTVPIEPKPGDLVGHTAGRIRLTLDLRPIERRDVNGDTKTDLVCGRHWFAQKLDGGFDTSPAEMLPELMPQPTGTLGEIRADINKDGRPDLLSPENKLDEPLHIVTYVRYYLAGKNGIDRSKPTGTIRGQNILIHTPLPVHDFNGDGYLDFAMFDTDIRLTEIGKWIRQSFGEIKGDLKFWYFDPKAGVYRQGHSYRKSIYMRFKMDLMDAMAGYVWERYLGTMMRFEGDFNGDKRPDLLVRAKTHSIALYFNTGNGRSLYPSKPDVLLDNVPTFGGLAIEDLNADGASDLLLYRGTDAFGSNPSPYDVIAVYISRTR